MSDPKSRREFLKRAALSGAALGAAAGGFAHAEDRPAAGAGPTAGGAARLAKVPRKKLGKTGVEVPILVMGCAQKFEKDSKVLRRAYAEGVNYLDTAIHYEGSHVSLVPFIKEVGRKNLWITSKGAGDTGGGTPAAFRNEIDRCLKEMEIDALDLYFMHAVDDPKVLGPEYLKMGDELRKSGKTRFFGFSCHDGRVAELLTKAAEVGGIDVIMFRYDFAKYGDLQLNKAIDAAKKANIGLIAMKTQRSVPDKEEKVVGFRSKNWNLAQAKLKAVWADERIDSAVSHIDNTQKLRENLDAALSPMQLSMSEFQQLQRLATATASLACAGCSHICEPLVQEPVKIASQLRFLMYHECYGDADRACSLYRQLEPAQRAFDGVDFSAATAACPQGIDIRARLEEARRLLARA